MKKSTKEFAIGTVIAAGVGYVTGILTAPKSGKETRKDIERAAQKAKGEAERRLKQLHAELSQLIDEAKTRMQTVRDDAKKDLNIALEKAVVAKEKVREVLSAVHE